MINNSAVNIFSIFLSIFLSHTSQAYQPRIEYGEKVPILKPFIASLLYDEGVDNFWIQILQEFVEKNKYYNHYCGGLIYTEHYVVTAAHCIKNGDFHYVGVYGLNYHHMRAYHRVINKIAHPNYVGESPYTWVYDYDIGLVKTETKIHYYGLLPPYNPSLGDIERNPIALYGWGKTENNEFSEYLQELDLDYAPSFPNCKTDPAVQAGRAFCFITRKPFRQAGPGDSGSPIVLHAVKPNETDTVLSVMSITVGPILKDGWYIYIHAGASLAYFVPWLNSTMR